MSAISDQEQLVLAEIAKHPHGISTTLLNDQLAIDVVLLMAAINALALKLHVELLSYADGSHGVRALDAAHVVKINNMSASERQVYAHIKQSKNKGTWVKDIKQKLGLHQQVVNQSIKQLERLGYIKSVKSVKAPTKKLYMVYST